MLQTKALTVMDQETLKDIWKLEEACKKQGTPPGELSLDGTLNCYPQMPYLYLLYEDCSLKSILSVFAPTGEEAEIYGCTHPESRRKGYFKRLLTLAEAELVKAGIPEILFVCEARSQEGKAMIERLGGTLSHTEYSLRYYSIPDGAESGMHTAAIIGERGNIKRLQLYKAEAADFNQLVDASCQIFNDTRENSAHYIRGTMESNHRQQLKAVLDGRIIGFAGVSRREGENSIFGLGILPDCQGKGYGREMLRQLLLHIRKEWDGDITLEVDSTNEKAFRLYTSEGFGVEKAFEYYRRKTARF